MLSIAGGASSPPRLERLAKHHTMHALIGVPVDALQYLDTVGGASHSVHGLDGRKCRLKLKDAAGECDQGGRRRQDKDGSAKLGLVDVGTQGTRNEKTDDGRRHERESDEEFIDAEAAGCGDSGQGDDHADRERGAHGRPQRGTAQVLEGESDRWTTNA